MTSHAEAESAEGPTWRLVLLVAEGLTAAGRSPFALAELVQEVQALDARRQRSSISPIVQGMTVNAPGGPKSACGEVLYRVSRGRYELVGDLPGLTPSVSDQRRRKSGIRPSLDVRLVGVTTHFDTYVEWYDRAVPFQRGGQWALHRRTVARRRTHDTVREALADDELLEMLYATLKKWGIGVRASRLVPLDAFRGELRCYVSELEVLDGQLIEDAAVDVQVAADALWKLIAVLEVVENKAKIVACTKTLHHLLPDLVPPMDRAWTGLFFDWSVADFQYDQETIFKQGFSELARVAQTTRPSRLVGEGWRTCPAKIMDNAIIGYCLAHDLADD